MKVLSLFDGMSCGMIALERAGIKVDTYYASEIDKYAIEISKKNYPQIVQVGDVCDLDPNDFKDVDLIIGGSPCQGFSFAGKQLAFDDPRSALFFEFVRLLEAIKPKYFLLENVRMKKEYLQIITDLLGVEPIFINSALVSAQSRQRYYWTNIPNIEEPEDRGIVLKDILEYEVSDEFRYGQKSIEYMERGNEKWQQAGKRRADRYEQSAGKEKSFTLTANWHKGVPYNYFKETKPKQVGIATDINGHDILKRVYSPEGKSPTLNSMGGGNREPKVAVSSESISKYVPDKNAKYCDPYNKKIIKGDKSTTLRTNSSNGNMWVNEQQEDLTWRKLTPLECERLQTVPDNYTEGVSNTQRYKMLGNGWTVEVIAHIFNNIDDRFKQSL